MGEMLFSKKRNTQRVSHIETDTYPDNPQQNRRLGRRPPRPPHQIRELLHLHLFLHHLASRHVRRRQSRQRNQRHRLDNRK